MRTNAPLSIIPYYGGKAKMSKFIAERLDYGCSTFITLFGGGARELLNKPPHNVEIYNEWDIGLSVLMETLSNPATAQELIDKLYYETNPTEDEFIQQQKIYNYCRYDLEEQCRQELYKFLQECGIDLFHINKLIDTLYQAHLLMVYQSLLKGNKIEPFTKEGLIDFYHAVYESRSSTEGLSIVKEGFDVDKALRFISYPNQDILHEAMSDSSKASRFDAILDDWLQAKSQKVFDVLPDTRTITESLPADIVGIVEKSFISDIDLAVATYVVYTLGFSGMPNNMGKNKFKIDEDYRKRILNLYRCSERLRGLRVLRMDAMSFFKQRLYEQSEVSTNSILYNFLINPDVMMFCDPSYINPNSEQELLQELNIDMDEIDISTTMVSTELEKAIQKREEELEKSEESQPKKRGRKKSHTVTLPKNLGKVYSSSFGYPQQEEFLRGIQNAQCKLMVCNYDLKLYNKYLTREQGWHKETFLTKTSVSSRSKQSNERLEVIWTNY